MSETGEIAAWLRSQAEADVRAAKAAAESTPAPWVATGEDIESATEDPFYRGICAANANGAEAEHIARHDPLTEEARAESVLAVLDLYEHEMLPTVHEPEPEVQELIEQRIYVLESVIGVLAAGYRFRDGWKETWA